jgi:hypothetical protein
MRGYVRLDGGGPCNAHAAAFGNDRCIARSADRQSQEIVHVRGREVSEFEISIVRLSPNATWRRRCDMDAALAPAVGSGRSRSSLPSARSSGVRCDLRPSANPCMMTRPGRA